jgi:hypothetical protein
MAFQRKKFLGGFDRQSPEALPVQGRGLWVSKGIALPQGIDNVQVLKNSEVGAIAGDQVCDSVIQQDGSQIRIHQTLTPKFVFLQQVECSCA